MSDCSCNNFPASLGNVTFGASVGIGTTSPAAILDVQTTWPSSSASNLMSSFTAYGDAARFVIRRADGTASAPTAVQSGDTLGNVNFRGYNGSGFTVGLVNINAVAEESYTTTANGTALTIGTTPIGSTGVAERVRINNAGNVGIGTTNPLEALHVTKGDANGVNAFFQKDTSSSGVAIGTVNGRGLITGANSNLTSTADLILNAYGSNVGIGTTSPQCALDVHGNINASGTSAPNNFAGPIYSGPAESHFWGGGTTFTDPASGVSMALKVGGGGIGVLGQSYFGSGGTWVDPNFGVTMGIKIGSGGIGVTGDSIFSHNVSINGGILLGGNLNLNGTIYNSPGSVKLMDDGGAYYAS